MLTIYNGTRIQQMRSIVPHVLYLAVIIVLSIMIIRMKTSIKVIQSIRASTPRKQPIYRISKQFTTFADYRCAIDKLVESAVEDFGPTDTKLSYACQFALQGGKRLRSIILCEIAQQTAAQTNTLCDPSEAALFIEYIHTASLIIDDTPAFDNDTVRRNRPTLHVAHGSALAQMAALSLVAAGVHNICRQVDWIRVDQPELDADYIGTLLCSIASQRLGHSGAARGQYMDILHAESLINDYGPDAVAELIYLKTATFFEIATTTGWLIAGGNPNSISLMRDIGKHVGLALQIADDISDMESDAARAAQGKPGWNFATVYGLESAKIEMEYSLEHARIDLHRCKCWSPIWGEIFGQIRKISQHAGANLKSAL